jgi:hypothetical protein
LLGAVALGVVACATTIAPFDPVAVCAWTPKPKKMADIASSALFAVFDIYNSKSVD